MLKISWLSKAGQMLSMEVDLYLSVEGKTFCSANKSNDTESKYKQFLFATIITRHGLLNSLFQVNSKYI